MKNSNSIYSLAILILLGFIWGSGYTLAKYAMTNEVPPLGYAFWQSLGPAFLLTIACALTSTFPLFRARFWPYFLVCGLIGIAIPNTNMYLIAKHIPAGLLAVIVNTVPLIVYPLALLTRQERFDSWRILALLLGLIGIFLILAPTGQNLISAWNLLAMVSPLAFALCSIYIAQKQPVELGALQAASGMLLAASLLLLPLVLANHAFYPLTPPFTVAKQVVLLEIVLSSIGYLLFFQLIRLAGPVFYSLVGCIVALTGLFWGFVVFHEQTDSVQKLAIICVICALFLLSWRQSQQKQGGLNVS